MGSSRDKDETLRALEDAYLEMFAGVRPEADGECGPAFSKPTPAYTDEPAPTGDAVSIVLSPDLMTVSLCATGTQPVAISPEDLYKALDRKGINTGIDKGAITQAAINLQTSGGWQGNLTVARGKPADPGPAPRFPFLERRVDAETGIVSWRCEGKSLDFSRLPKLLSQSRLKEMRRAGCWVRVVVPGEVIATFDKTLTTHDGVDVFGRPVAVAPYIVVGENVHFHPQDNSLRSMQFGYLHIEENIVSVLSPIWITPDRMSAVFISLPQVGNWRAPSVSQLEFLLRRKGVEDVFIRPESLVHSIERLKRREKGMHFVKVAAGVPVHHGENATLTRSFEAEARDGTSREGDSLDSRERDLITSVHKGALLAEKVLATKGSDGRTLFGEPLKAAPGEDIHIHASEGIKEEKQDGKILYIAKQDGVVSFRDNRLTIADLFVVNGDIDQRTGNIDVTTPVLVKGSMTSGFSLKSGGDVNIWGTVEPDCTIVANGNLYVGGGILGGKTRIITFGELRAKFIQGAEAIVQGDILVKSYIYYASIRCGGTVTVTRGLGELGGKIIGGVVCATRGINASSIGSEACHDTLLILQNKPENLLTLGKIDAELTECNEKLLKITRTLNINSLSPHRLKTLLAGMPPNKRDAMLKALHILNEMIKHRDALTIRKKELRAKMARELSEGVIRATGTFYQGNTVQFGDRKFIASSDLSPAMFQLKDGMIVK